MTDLLAILCNVCPPSWCRFFPDRVVVRAMQLLLEDYFMTCGQPARLYVKHDSMV